MMNSKSLKHFVMMVMALVSLMGSQLSFAASQQGIPAFDITKFSDFLKDSKDVGMSRPGNNERNWTDASCQQACRDAGCLSYQYIASKGGGTCTCSNCNYGG